MITETQHRQKVGKILASLADELDVPPSKYQDASDRYNAVGGWLNEKDSGLAPYTPTIFPQGSFALGTAIRPLGDENYDVDAVCLLQLIETEMTQPELKKMVGDRLKAHETYARMLEPKNGGRRCWTLKYADESKFHLDILPAIPDSYEWLTVLGVSASQAKHAICITDMEIWSTDTAWPKSNPKGYEKWFKDRMRVVWEERRRMAAVKKRVEVEQIPDYEVRTPLQRVIQLLKRHRDVKYNGDADKPISIIITTLAAQAYNNEPDVLDTLLNILPKMRDSIEMRDGVYWVANPVNPQENFADKWGEKPRKREVFFEWLDSVENLFQNLLMEQGFTKEEQCLYEVHRQLDTLSALKKNDDQSGDDLGTGLANSRSVSCRRPSCFDVSHRELIRWPIALQYDVKITAQASRKGFRTFNLESDSQPLSKEYSLCFKAKTNVSRPYNVHWQVVNTGTEARRDNSLRGGFYPGERRDCLIREESTLYRGVHWIECFIVKNGKCVARSGEFVVNIQ